MIDIAIGVIIGAAFNEVVNILVKEVLMPPLSFITNGKNRQNKKVVLREAVAIYTLPTAYLAIKRRNIKVY